MVDIYVGPDSNHWILHEKLLCHHSPFFAKLFYDKSTKASSTKAYGMPETEDLPFRLLVGWLYSATLRYPSSENDIGPLLDLYLLSQTLQMAKLGEDVVETVRQFYHDQESYPGLRRVQYVYANTEDDNPMREMMVSAVARFLTLSEGIPAHWDRALRKNGQLAVDIIRAIQEWHLESRSVPDAREVSAERGRVGFSGVDEVVGEDSGREDEGGMVEKAGREGERNEEGKEMNGHA